MFRKYGFITAFYSKIVSLASVLCQGHKPQALMTRHVRQDCQRRGGVRWASPGIAGHAFRHRYAAARSRRFADLAR